MCLAVVAYMSRHIWHIPGACVHIAGCHHMTCALLVVCVPCGVRLDAVAHLARQWPSPTTTARNRKREPLLILQLYLQQLCVSSLAAWLHCVCESTLHACRTWMLHRVQLLLACQLGFLQAALVGLWHGPRSLVGHFCLLSQGSTSMCMCPHPYLLSGRLTVHAWLHDCQQAYGLHDC